MGPKGKLVAFWERDWCPMCERDSNWQKNRCLDCGIVLKSSESISLADALFGVPRWKRSEVARTWLHLHRSAEKEI